jgi:hypothetical protein
MRLSIEKKKFKDGVATLGKLISSKSDQSVILIADEESQHSF